MVGQLFHDDPKIWTTIYFLVVKKISYQNFIIDREDEKKNFCIKSI